MSTGAQARRTLVWLGVIAAAAAAGYVVTLAIFPAPILSRKYTVPTLRGATVQSAVTRLEALRLRARITDTVADPLTPAGTIAWQSPAPQTQLPEAAVVRLAVSNGAPQIAMPDVSEFDVGVAQQVVTAAGLVVAATDTVPSPLDFGSVVATSIRPGTRVTAGDSVVIDISSGPASIVVPGLVGLPVEGARERLVAAGFRIGALTQRFDGRAGMVIAQQPLSGQLAARGSTIDLTISGAMP
jgi:serine/threonine-protein kinase